MKTVEWKWKRNRSGYWSARRGQLLLWLFGGDEWRGLASMVSDDWADNSLYRVSEPVQSRRAAQRAAERVAGELLQDAYVAIRRKMQALGVEIPDGEE